MNHFLLAIFLITSIPCFAQPARGTLKGKVTDGLAQKPLFDVFIRMDTLTENTSADGSYLASPVKGSYTVSFSLPGFQTKSITGVAIHRGQTTHLDIVLFPVSSRSSMKPSASDSLASHDTSVSISFYKESGLTIYNPASHANGVSDLIGEAGIQPGTDKDGVQLLKRLNGVIVQETANRNGLYSLNISGLGERYNQVLFNGAVLNSSDPVSRAYPLGLFSSEIIESVSLQKTGNASLPADFAGGSAEIRTKDFPDRNFYYVLAGAGISANTNGEAFLGERRDNREALGFPGKIRDLPAGFPTTRSQSAFHQKNLQEQVYLSKQLNNNLAPADYGNSKPDERASFGFGRIIRLKGAQKIGITAFLNHYKSELISGSSTQALPDVAGNPYPFSGDKVLIRSQSNDISYRYLSQFSAMVNASILFGRNKISMRNFFSSQIVNTYTSRSAVFKPDEDTLAHAGINYQAEQRTLLNVQLSGEHALGENSRLKINWLASYAYYRQRNPDERNFLLRQDSVNKNLFEIARPSAASLSTPDAMFTNSGRSWREFTDHNFIGAVNLSFPFNMFRMAQVLSGGVYLQTKYRVFFSDLLLTQGRGYAPLENLLAPERYFPGGLTVSNYYKNVRILGGSGNYTLDATNRGNYTGSVNTGASYIMLENRVTDKISSVLGIRLESNSQLVSNSQYNYFTGYKNPQLATLDENNRVFNIDFLPSVKLMYEPVGKVRLHASYFKTVNRPQLQELVRYRYYEAMSFIVKAGNPALANSTIQNYDAGVIWIPNASANIAVSGFYKEIDQPIEYILSGFANARGNLSAAPFNTSPAVMRGLNASFKIGLDIMAEWLSPVSVFASGTWIKSKVAGGPVRSEVIAGIAEHTLSGSPEYSVNAGLVVQHSRLPMLTVLYRRTSDYISVLGSGRSYTLANGNIITAIPDYRVKGMDQFDLQISQKIIGSRLQIIGGVTNLLDNQYIGYQDLNGNKKFDGALVTEARNNSGQFYKSGTDNTVISSQSQRTWYVTLSYLFK